MKIEVNKCPYELDKKIYKYSELDLNPGITILIGRNGSGKSTLLHEISEYCKKNKIHYFKYDNYTEGGTKASEAYAFLGDFNSLCSTAFHSEGEQIFYNFGQTCRKIGKYLSTIPKEDPVIIMLDAMDSGLDCDGISQMLSLYEIMRKDRKGDIYFLITANNYGLIHKQRCIDVVTGKEMCFERYEDFKKFIDSQYKELRKRG